MFKLNVPMKDHSCSFLQTQSYPFKLPGRGETWTFWSTWYSQLSARHSMTCLLTSHLISVKQSHTKVNVING